MNLLVGAIAAARSLPWQAWAVIALAFAVGLYGCNQYDAGGDAARLDIHRSNETARGKADEAARDVENCIGTWDRARGLCLPDGTGR